MSEDSASHMSRIGANSSNLGFKDSQTQCLVPGLSFLGKLIKGFEGVHQTLDIKNVSVLGQMPKLMISADAKLASLFGAGKSK